MLTLGLPVYRFAALGTWRCYDQYCLVRASVLIGGYCTGQPLLPIGRPCCWLYFVADGVEDCHFTLRCAWVKYLPLEAPVFSLVFINIFFPNITPWRPAGGLCPDVVSATPRRQALALQGAATTIRTLLAVIFYFYPDADLSLSDLGCAAPPGFIWTP